MTCPICSGGLIEEKGKLNLGLARCGQDHGSFVEAAKLQYLVEERTTRRIRELTDQAGAGGACPNCGTEMRQVDLNGLATEACPNCGGLWFGTAHLERFHQEWRSRAYGQDSFVNRAEVLEGANKLHAAEVISGVLTEFDMSLEE